MKNRGQTTILFSLIISVIFLFTLSVLEIGRIKMSKVKIKSIVHSTRLSIMADYHSELFERYHLLFMDPCYQTGTEGAFEEKVEDYLDSSLNGESGSGIYEFYIEDIALVDQKKLSADRFKQVKEQIADYEKIEGVPKKAKELAEKFKDRNKEVGEAAQETEINGQELPIESETTKDTDKENADKGEEEEKEEEEVTDPRETLQEALKGGILSVVLPGDASISKEEQETLPSFSLDYQEEVQEKKDSGFQDIGFLKRFLNHSAEEDNSSDLVEKAAFVDYVNNNFSNYANPKEESLLECEVEYILKGKTSDYDNLEEVTEDIIWMRLPMNYAYLLKDTQKKTEALTLAATICTSTGTPQLIEIVKYLLLGCWAYGESLCEVRNLLSGEEIAYIKTKQSWNTDLKHLAAGSKTTEVKNGFSYEDFLMLFLATKSMTKEDTAYARMLDVIQFNLRKEEPDFELADCVGGLTFQGKVKVNSLFVKGKQETLYEYYVEESFSY